MSLEKILHQVPPGYYYNSLRTNLLQVFWHTQRFRKLRQFLKGKKGRILDIGCADGVFTNEIFQALEPNSKVTAIDIYLPSIQFARKMYPHIIFKHAPAEKLPFPEKSFDYVTCLEMLEHVKDPKKVLQEMKRVLKKDGSIFILVPQETFLFRFIWFWWTKLKGKVWDHAHLQHFYLDSLGRYFQNQGFRVKKKQAFLLNMLMIFELTS